MLLVQSIHIKMSLSSCNSTVIPLQFEESGIDYPKNTFTSLKKLASTTVVNL